MSENGLHVVFLPKWYPDKFDPQNGVFIQKHADAVSQYAKVTVLYATTDENVAKTVYEEVHVNKNLTEIRVYYPPRKMPVFGKALTAIRYTELMLAKLKEINNKRKINIVHGHVLLRTAMIARWFALKNNIPFVISEHWSGYGSGLYNNRSSIEKWLCRKVVREANVVTAVTPFLKETMQDCGLNANYNIVPNVVDFNEPIDSEVDSEKTIYLTIGDLNDNIKNISSLIKVFSSVFKGREDVELHIIGGGYDELELMELAGDLGALGNLIIFHSRQSHDYVKTFLPKAEIYINNSRFETFSVTVAEAVANKIPVITTKCGGPQSFFNKSMGVEIPVDDDNALKAAIEYMFTTHKQYNLKEASEQIKEQFSAQTVGKQFLELYKSLI